MNGIKVPKDEKELTTRLKVCMAQNQIMITKLATTTELVWMAKPRDKAALSLELVGLLDLPDKVWAVAQRKLLGEVLAYLRECAADQEPARVGDLK